MKTNPFIDGCINFAIFHSLFLSPDFYVIAAVAVDLILSRKVEQLEVVAETDRGMVTTTSEEDHPLPKEKGTAWSADGIVRPPGMLTVSRSSIATCWIQTRSTRKNGHGHWSK